MSRLGRVARRADQWSSPHERARSLAAERIDTALEPAEADWLEEHLEGCAACAAIAAAYDADRLELRALRDVPLEPPRDLWARTSAGIEREASRRGRVPRRASGSSSGRSRIPLGALSGIAVVAILVGATALSGGWLDQPTVAPAETPAVAAATPNVAVATVAPAATPIAVTAGKVGWLQTSDDGGFDYNDSRVDQVCPPEDQPGCAALDDSAPKRITLDATPKSIIGSPTDDQAVVVGSNGSGADQVFVMSLPTDPEASTATPSPTPSATIAPSATAPASAAPSPSETASTEPSPSDTASAAPTDTPSTGPASASPVPTPAETATPEPTPAATPEPTPASTPQATAKAIAIASGVTVVGQSAAFSADGSWFAFTARPSDGSAGPDIYVWHVGGESADRLTTDGSSLFASWDGDMVVGSRLVVDDTADGVPAAISFIADPQTGETTGDPIALWRPVVDPTGRFAVAWSGTVTAGDDGTRLDPEAGELVITSWQPDADTAASRSKIPGIDGAVADFDVRWDETGEWLAIWTAKATDPTVGRLSLFRLDRRSGDLERPKSAPTDVPALPGFSIGDGRLAWVTPHGQDAEGSKVQVVAWSGGDVGAVESVPGEGVVVVR